MESGRVLAEAPLGCLEVALLAPMVVVPLVLWMASVLARESVAATMAVCCLFWEWVRLLREPWENPGSRCCAHLDATWTPLAMLTSGHALLDATGRAHLPGG